MLDFNEMVHADYVDVDNINKASAVTIQDVDLDGYDVNLNYAGSSNINNSLTLKNVANGDVNVDANQTAAGGTYTVTLDGVADVDFYTSSTVETLNVVVASESTGVEIMNYSGFDADDAVVNLTLNADLQVDWWDVPDDSDSTTTFNITGSGNLTIYELDDGSSDLTVDGSTATGNIDITFGDLNAVSVTTGSGNDRIVLDNDYFVADSGLVVDLGEGSNTLGIMDVTSDTDMNALDFSDVTLSGVTALEFADDITLAADVSVDLVNLGEIEKFVVAGFNGVGYELSLENAQPLFAIEAKGDFYDTYLALSGVEDLTVSGTGWLDIEDIDAADLVSLTLDSADEIDAYLGWQTDYDLSSLETLTVSTPLEEVDAYAWIELYDGVSSLTDVNITSNWAGLYVEDADALETVSLTGGSDYYTQDAYLEVVGAESLATATLSGIEAYVYLEDTPAFTTLDISAISDYADVDAALAAFEGTVTIKIGESDVDYYADTVGNGTTLLREVFSFVGTDIGDIWIENYLAGVGANGDRLDFSKFAAVDSLDDLNISLVDADIDGQIDDTVITATGDQFTGTITVIGVDISADAYNFIV